MNWFGYKNISKIIMITTILIILSNTILISLFYYKNQINEYGENLKTLEKQTLEKQKINLKKDINTIIKMIEFKYSKDDLKKDKIKEEIKLWISSIPFNEQKSDYIFVYELINKNGGDDFAKMIINPNRIDLVGKCISTNYKDINGFCFRKKFLNDINIKGDSIVSYSYKKTTKKIENKISYFKYYEPFNWIIAKGVYSDDIKHEMIPREKFLKQKVIRQIKQNILSFILFFIIAIIITYFIDKKIQNIIEEKEAKVKKTTRALAVLNRELDSRVKVEVEKNKEQEQILIQRSKFIALGKTISLIAHQWRQPISELSAIILNIKLHHRLKKLDSKMMNEKTHEIETLLEYMSKTIDDFRTFFKPNKIKKEFYIYESIKRVLDILKPMLSEYKIKISLDIDETIKLNNFQNEFEQVVLNLISNAKDAIISDDIKIPNITINIYKDDLIHIEVCDNAKGINEDIIDKIFEPYFTTKDEANGTGIGLYMSKIICEKNMGGKLEVESSKFGSRFKIKFKV